MFRDLFVQGKTLHIISHPILERRFAAIAPGVVALVEARSPQSLAQRRVVKRDLLDKALAETRKQGAQVLRRIARTAESEVDDAACVESLLMRIQAKPKPHLNALVMAALADLMLLS